jgi:hypothetical protein
VGAPKRTQMYCSGFGPVRNIRREYVNTSLLILVTPGQSYRQKAVVKNLPSKTY